jgi:hypothetical protein
MRKRKENEELRRRTLARSKRSDGRAAEPTRSEKDRLEIARAKCRDMAADAVLTLGKGLRGKATAVQLKAADSILDRAGIPRGHEVQGSVDFGGVLLEIFTKTPPE